ncbi:MAG TPA: sigma-70 family RNA polymerase sigma factor [Thermoanaerobaculia bacterium]|nr:sigma-70 family RNA polymerase sigma factor [Thermoanaerobaculia bacterium]
MTAIEEIFRSDWGRLLSALIHLLGDFDVAEEALQDAFAIAVTEWADGVPQNPSAWLYGTARHKAIDRLRRQSRFAEKQVELAAMTPAATEFIESAEEPAVPDERLRLIFTCCHPALQEDAQVALTLRTLCGLTTEEIARAFLVPVATMAQRLVRAKSKIRGAAIPYRVPPASELRERLSAVMAVVYLVFNEGYAAASGTTLVRHDLCAEAIRLGRMLRMLMPDPDLDALLALMLLHDSRRNARMFNGLLVLLADQDRKLWDRAEIDEGRALLQSSLRRSAPSTYALEAAIAAVHADATVAADTDWRQIVILYARLYAQHPTPIVALNRAVAISMADGPAAALPLVEALADSLDAYHLWHAARADLLRRLGRADEALGSYRRAYELTSNEAERRFLARRIGER